MRVVRLNLKLRSSPMQKAVDQLDRLIFDTLQGDDTWYELGDSPYRFFIEWSCFRGNVGVSRIKGRIRGVPYRLCMLTDQVTLYLPDLVAVFTNNPEYGSFSTPGNMYLTNGHSAWYERNKASVEEFWKRPDEYHKNKHWLITPPIERQCADFILDLVNVITRHKENSNA